MESMCGEEKTYLKRKKMTNKELIFNWEFEQELVSRHSLNLPLYKEMIKCKEADKISDELALLFLKISKKVVNRLNISDEDRKDLINHGVLFACQNYTNFNPERSNNPAAYMLQVIKSGHARIWIQLHRINERQIIPV